MIRTNEPWLGEPGPPEAPGRGPAQRVPRAERMQVMWSWVAVLAMVFVLGVTFYTIDARQDQQTAAQRATTTSTAGGRTAVPAPATGESTIIETTGQGDAGGSN